MSVENYPEEVRKEIEILFQQWEKEPSSAFLAVIHMLHLMAGKLGDGYWQESLESIARSMLMFPRNGGGVASPAVYREAASCLQEAVDLLRSLIDLGVLDVRPPKTAGTPRPSQPPAALPDAAGRLPDELPDLDLPDDLFSGS